MFDLEVALWSANIKDNPDLATRLARLDIAAVGKAAKDSLARFRGRRAPVIGWQEFGSADDHANLETVLPASAWLHLEQDHATPITLARGPWEVLEHGWEKAHGGLEKTSPDRGTSWAVVKWKPRPGLRPFVITNRHMVSGAYTHPGQTNEAWRREHWPIHHHMDAGLIEAWKAEGLTVFGTGDLNRLRPIPNYTHDTRWLHDHSLDHIFVDQAPRGVKVTKVVSRPVLPLSRVYTDHAPIGVRVRVRNA